MASEIRVNKINSRTGVGTITLSPTGVDFTGIATVATLKATTGIVTTLSATGNATVGGTLGVTGDVDVADKIVHTGDTNTAIRFPAADTFTVETAGSERLRIHDDGEVQILGENAATGQTPLSVEGNYASSGNVDIQTWARSGGAVKAAMRYVDADTLLKFGTTTNHGFAFITNATEALRINSAGEVGIGTVTPGRTLHLATSGNNNVYLHLTHDGTGHTDSDGADLRLNRSTDALDIMNLENAPIKFFTNGENERMRILSGGGLTFNGDSATANALDDYEEGDHTCSVTAGTSGTITLSASTLSYVKIGNLVSVQGRLDVSSVSSPTGELELSMPFANGSGTKNHATPSVFIWQANSSEAPNTGLWVGFMGASTSTLNLRYGDSHTPGADGAAAMQANSEIRIVLSYRTV